MIHQGTTIAFGFDEQIRRFLIFIGISFFGHVSLFAFILFVHLPGNYHLRILEPETISVDLMGFNPETPLPPPKGEAPVSKPEDAAKPLDDSTDAAIDKLIDKVEKMPDRAEPEKPPVKEALEKKVDPDSYTVEKPEKEKVVEKPKKENITKKPLVKKNIDPAKILEKAVKRMEKQAESSQPKSITDRIASLKKEVQGSAQPVGSPYGSEGPDASSSAGSSSRNFSQIEIFVSQVSMRMKNNWVFSEKLAGETRGLESRLVIKIMPDGTITDVWFEKRSGNTYLDNSAYKTVMKSNPLPPLPEGMPYYHLVLGFTPSGLN
ncbi:MAG: cell envelope integrity protein TolA [Desulfobacteraceae bacterium]|nr:MAG: cell envelope integrity protein TolA [Desulfobacteraceae bacterium]